MRKLAVIFAAVLLSTTALAQGSATDLEAEVMKTEPVPLQAGEYADIWIRVTNKGDATASDAEVEVVDEFPFHTDDRKDTWEIGELLRGQSYHIRAKIRVNENAVFGNNTLKLRKTSGNQNVWTTQSLNLPVRTDDRSLIISNLGFPERVEPGSSAKMNVTLENLANSHFRNIDVRLDVSGVPVAPRETSRKRISRVGPNSSGTVSFTLDVDDDAENELHDLPITIDYQNQAGQEFSVTETTGVNIGGYPNIDVAVDETDLLTSGRGTVTLRIVNKGEGQARFVEVGIEDTEQYEVLSEESIYLGSMIPDDYQTAEFELYAEDNGDLEIPVNVDYRDGEGDQEKEFTIEQRLYSSSELGRYGLQQRGSIWVLVLVALAVTGTAFYYWRRKRD